MKREDVDIFIAQLAIHRVTSTSIPIPKSAAEHGARHRCPTNADPRRGRPREPAGAAREKLRERCLVFTIGCFAIVYV